METQSPEIAKMFVPKLLKQENVDALLSKEKTMDDLETQVSKLERWHVQTNRTNSIDHDVKSALMVNHIQV